MNKAKEKFIRKYARPDEGILKDDGTIVEHHQQLESDLDALLKEEAIKFAIYYADKSRVGIDKSYSQWKQITS